MGHELVPYKFPVSDIQYQIPDFSNPYMCKKTMSEIKNAWNKNAFIDNFGRVWVNSKGLRSLLRVTKEYAKYYIGGFPDEYKYEYDNAVLIKGEVICALLDQRLQNAGNVLKENYLRYSEMFYRAIRDCDYAKNIRNEFYCYVDKMKPQLKKQRISFFSIKYDELTNQELNFQKCEFSHIRSAALYPIIATSIGNGLIINKSTHEIITSYGICDENQLLVLCNENGWNTNWYDMYVSSFGRLND